jgi:hypothetical protein
MTKQTVTCPVCTEFLGNVHGQDVSDTISKHIIWTHSQLAKHIVEIGLKIEAYQAEFKRLSGTYSSEAIHDYVNQNTMRRLGFSEEEIDKRLRS